MPTTVVGELIGWDIVIVLVVILVLFGGSQLPKLAKNLGRAQREFKSAMHDAQGGTTAENPAPATDGLVQTD